MDTDDMCVCCLTTEQLDKLREMWENGCPTYDRSGIHLNENCWFCNEDIEFSDVHLPSCPWLTLEELFGTKTDTTSNVRTAQERKDDTVQTTIKGASSSGCE